MAAAAETAGRPAAIGFLHTASSHVAAFRFLLHRHAPGLADVHLVREDLLVADRTDGDDAALVTGLRSAVDRLVAEGADVVVCTCSTLGAAAERLGSDLGVPVLRVDRPMADAAVRLGPRIGVVVAAASAAAPARHLLRSSAAAAGVDLQLTETLCPDAWAAFEIGDAARYVREVADAARALPPGLDAVVLAQASMAGAAPLLSDLGCPVLTSPTLAVLEAVRVTPSRLGWSTAPR